MLYKFVDTKSTLFSIYKGEYPLVYIFFIKLIQIKKNILSMFYWKFNNYENIEWIKNFNIKHWSFNTKNRKNGISAFGRLYNAEDFLEKTVESHIQYFDEIILVNNNSTDNTEEICIKLEKKHPDKVKFYNYPHEVYKIWTKKYNSTKDNSIHSLSYYYNWTLSQTTHRYTIKLDDDHLCIDTEILRITTHIREKWLNCFLQTPLLNVFNNKDKLSYSYKNLKSTYAWLFGDFWFFPVSEYTYFIKQTSAETIIFPFKIKNEVISFLHLKWIKPSLWLNNYWKSIQKKLTSRINHNKYITLSKNYSNILKKNWIK